MEYEFDTGLLEKQAEEAAKRGLQRYKSFFPYIVRTKA